MQKTRDRNRMWALYLGTLLLIVIVSAVVWSEYKTYHLGTWVVPFAGGFLFWFIAFASTRHDASAGPQVKSDPAKGCADAATRRDAVADDKQRESPANPR